MATVCFLSVAKKRNVHPLGQRPLPILFGNSNNESLGYMDVGYLPEGTQPVLLGLAIGVEIGQIVIAITNVASKNTRELEHLGSREGALLVDTIGCNAEGLEGYTSPAIQFLLEPVPLPLQDAADNVAIDVGKLLLSIPT